MINGILNPLLLAQHPQTRLDLAPFLGRDACRPLASLAPCRQTPISSHSSSESCQPAKMAWPSHFRSLCRLLLVLLASSDSCGAKSTCRLYQCGSSAPDLAIPLTALILRNT